MTRPAREPKDVALLYAELCDIVERAYQRLPVDPGPDDFPLTSNLARLSANRILDSFDEFLTSRGITGVLYEGGVDD